MADSVVHYPHDHSKNYQRPKGSRDTGGLLHIPRVTRFARLHDAKYGNGYGGPKCFRKGYHADEKDKQMRQKRMLEPCNEDEQCGEYQQPGYAICISDKKHQVNKHNGQQNEEYQSVLLVDGQRQ